MILDEIAEKTRIRIAREKERVSPEELKERVSDLIKEEARRETIRYPFCKSLVREGLSFICEVKKASPSKGLIAGDFPYLEIAREYEEAGDMEATKQLKELKD